MHSIDDEVNFGLQQFDESRRVEMPLRDALYAFKVLGEFIRFFHQPLHWQTLQDVEQFIGDRDQGAFHVLCEAYHHRLRHIWPQDVEEAFDAGTLDAGFAARSNRGRPRSVAVSVAPAANVLVPAILALETQGFTVTCNRTDVSETWSAVRGNTNVSATDPVQLLGLASMVSTRGASWQASDQEIASAINRFDLA